jgi:Ser/Thr protein kinase RdoA (MazF antagonist)
LQRRERDSFAPDELAVVLSHYDLGIIESVTEFKRGSRRSPKVGIVSQRGKFLLKKRARGRGGVDRARYAHAIQSHLTAKGFALPKLIQPKDSDDTMLYLQGSVYEMFDYMAGHPYSGEGEETRDAGRMLAVFHQMMSDFPANGAYTGSGYHDATSVQTGLNAIPAGVSSHESAVGKDAEILSLTSFLYEAYTEAAAAVERAGYPNWPDSVAHSDWHPGNLLFRHGRVLAVLDYDCARIGKASCDVGNGALQFSMVGRGDPVQWPDHTDLPRVKEFIEGYGGERGVSKHTLAALPYLMIEALIAESVLPIAATGQFGPFDGFGFMQMIRRKVTWIQRHAGELQTVA